MLYERYNCNSNQFAEIGEAMASYAWGNDFYGMLQDEVEYLAYYLLHKDLGRRAEINDLKEKIKELTEKKQKKEFKQKQEKVMLIDTIKKDMITAKKAGQQNKGSLLNTLYAEAVTVGKNAGNRETTDTEVVTVIKKFIKNLEETLSVLPLTKQDPFLEEVDILGQYLPKQLTSVELEDIIKVQKTEGKNMGEIMKYLKDAYPGLYDGKVASEIAKRI